MSMSYAYTETIAFTETHARHMSAKVAADLKRMQRLYDYPSDASIGQYEAELTALLKAGYLRVVTYGFKRGTDWIEPTLQYTARDLSGLSASDDDPGRVRPGANVTGASFYSYLEYSAAWDRLSVAQKQVFEGGLPFHRSTAPEPGVSGYFAEDRTYSSGGRALDRKSIRSYSS